MFRFSARGLIITSEPGPVLLLTLGLKLSIQRLERKVSNIHPLYAVEALFFNRYNSFLFPSPFFFLSSLFPLSLGLYSFLVGISFRLVGARLDSTVRPTGALVLVVTQGPFSGTIQVTHADRAGICPSGCTRKYVKYW